MFSYEYEGIVYCQWKQVGAAEFSDPIEVSVHSNAELPDIYPNGGDGVTFAFQADSTGAYTDVYYRTCNVVEVD